MTSLIALTRQPGDNHGRPLFAIDVGGCVSCENLQGEQEPYQKLTSTEIHYSATDLDLELQ